MPAPHFCARWSKNGYFRFFFTTPSRKYHIRFRLKIANVIFSPHCCQIVYYAPREEKTETVHTSCKLPNTRCGLANFTPVERILFFTIPGPKIPHSRFWAGSENGTFGQSMVKNSIRNTDIKMATPEHMLANWQFTRALDWTILYLPSCVIYYFQV